MWVGGLGSSTSFVGVGRFPVLCGFGTVDVGVFWVVSGTCVVFAWDCCVFLVLGLGWWLLVFWVA